MPRGDAPAERIRETALTLFAEHGVAGTSLQMIADALGVTKAAVYFRYRTKEDIVRAVLAPAFDELDALTRAAEEVAPDERPRFLVEGMARQAVRHHGLYSIVLQDVTAAALRRETPDHLATFSRLRDGLGGTRSDVQSRVKVAMFLQGLTAAAVEPEFDDVEPAELERAVIAAGRGVLGLE